MRPGGLLRPSIMSGCGYNFQFEEGPAITALPASFAAAITASAGGTQNSTHDTIVGSACSGQGWCANPNYQNTVYCACVNNNGIYPQCIFTTCANQPMAYKTTQMRDTPCPPLKTLCQNVISSASGNLYRNNQYVQCGDSGPPPFSPTEWVKKNQVLVGIFVVIVVLVLLLAIGEVGHLFEHSRSRGATNV